MTDAISHSYFGSPEEDRCLMWINRAQCSGKRVDHKPVRASAIGSRVRVTRLDGDGQPVSVSLDISGASVTWFGAEPGRMYLAESAITEVDRVPDGWLREQRMEFTIKDPEPDAFALLFGGPLKPRPFWWRWVPKKIQRKIKWRELRRGYGG